MLTIVDEPGAYGLEKLMTSAARKKLPDGSFELRWNSAGSNNPLTVKFRLISGGGASNNDAPTGSNGLKGLQLVTSIAVAAAPPASPTSAAVSSTFTNNTSAAQTAPSTTGVTP